MQVEETGGGYVYRLMKTKIKAQDGAEGLVSFLEQALEGHFMTCLAWRVLDYAADNMRPAKTRQ